MEERFTPATGDRRQALRRSLVLDLYTHHGDFWEAVRDLRKRWRIEVRTQLPPPLPSRRIWLDSVVGHRPEAWPGVLPPSARHPAHGTPRPGPRFDDVVPPPEWAEPNFGDHPAEAEWWADVEALHDEVIPASCTRPGRKAKPLWAPFLSACVLYDPPPDQLLRFADAQPRFVDLPPTQGEWVAEPASGGASGGSASPIVFVRDARQTARNAYAAWVDALDVVAEQLQERGIDLWALIEAAVVTQPELSERARNRHAVTRTRPYIKVTAETRDEDVRQARRVLQAALPGSPTAGRPPVDDLVKVQCALWRDQLGRSEEQIARVFGWEVSHVGGNLAQPRIELVRDYTIQGNKLLKDRGAPL